MQGALLCAVLLAAGAARAQEEAVFRRGIDLVPHKATPAMESGLVLEGGELEPAQSQHGQLLLDFNVGLLSFKDGDEKLGNLLPYRLDAHLLLSYALHQRLELGVDLPFTALQGDNFGLVRERMGDNYPGGAGVSAQALGDLRVVPRVGLLSQNRGMPLSVALVGEVRAPTGSKSSFTGGRFVVAPRLALERRFGERLRVLGNFGWRLREAGQYLNLYVGHEFHAGAGVQVGLGDVSVLKQLKLTGEVLMSTPASNPFTVNRSGGLKTPLEALVGARARLTGPWGVELAVGRGIGLESGYGREALRVMLSLRYDRTFIDSDGDGVPDNEDKCPTELEDRDGYQDSDGCPDPDNDGDGINDGQDKCPLKPGPADSEGCPDTDEDGLPDHVDKCPEEAGPPENDGCPFDEPPMVVVESDRIRIKGNIGFETGKANIRPESFPLLDGVVDVLKKNPKLGPVLIEGHTDNVGARAYNLSLSDQRAKAVRKYLIDKGIEAKRLSAKGFGFDRPIAPNTTPMGRAQNRRVDFRLVAEDEEGTSDGPVPREPTAPAPQPAPTQGTPDAGVP